jgi:cell division septal protein FtsQ
MMERTERNPDKSRRSRPASGIGGKIAGFAVLAVFAYAFPFVVLKKYGAWLDHARSFRVRSVEVRGNDLVPEKEVLRLAAVERKRTVWSVTPEAAESRIRSNPFIRSARVVRCFPDRIRIEVVEKRPVALFKADGRLYTLDQEATVLPALPGRCYTLPILSCPADGPLAVGRRAAGTGVTEGLAFLAELSRNRPAAVSGVSEILTGPSGGLIVTTARDGVPVRLGRGGLEWKIPTLDAILSELDRNRSLAGASYIDLRFRGRVFIGFGV